MTEPLHMVQIRFDLPALLTWAREHGAAPGQDEDLGYAAHAVLAAAFGSGAPKPFRLSPMGGRRLDLLGYGPWGAARLGETLAACADPSLARALPATAIDSKEMPAQWLPGRSYGFEVRFCPLVRQDRPVAGGPPDRRHSREVDAFLVSPPGSLREAVYADLLATELARGGAARLMPENTRMTGFRRLRLARRGALAKGGGRPFRARIERPVAIFAGSLEIADGASFATLLARGIGRHRAFGFGLLLLRPGG